MMAGAAKSDLEQLVVDPHRGHAMKRAQCEEGWNRSGLRWEAKPAATETSEGYGEQNFGWSTLIVDML